MELASNSIQISNSGLVSAVFRQATTHPEKVALFESSGEYLTYGYLAEIIRGFENGQEQFVFLVLNSNIYSISTLLCLLNRGVSVAIVSENTDSGLLDELCSKYRPDAIYGSSSVLEKWGLGETSNFLGICKVEYPTSSDSIKPIEIPQILLGTSGSTGSPKMVRLAYSSLDANAADISSGLGIIEDDVAMTVLPLSYTYGLSVVTSHLWAGASVFCSSLSPLDKDFIPSIARNKVTNLAGVPFNFAIYKKIGLFNKLPQSVRYFSQAGGALGLEEVRSIRALLADLGVSFYVMYGQTEATARIAICPPEILVDHPDSVGYSVESGYLKIGSTNDVNEIVFTGPNVMMGYALNRDDLSKPDELHGVLETGDLGYLEDGLLFVTGRIKRIAKINGIRINIEELESKISSFCEAAITSNESKILVFWVGEAEQKAEIEKVLNKSSLLARDFELLRVDSIPRLASGKIDYPKLAS